MAREEKKLQKHLQQKANEQLRKAAQTEKKQRRSDQHKGTGGELRNFEEPETFRAPKVKRTSLGSAAAEPESTTGIVVETGAGASLVVAGHETVRCKCDTGVAVGDRVLFSVERRRITGVLPRSSCLSRPDPHNPLVERVVAANIDVVVNVVSVRTPPLRPGLIDRYLIAIENSGAEPLICVNKADLIAEDAGEIASLLAPYRAIGIAVVLCSANTGQGLQEMTDLLAGRMCVFAGHSGVGKSSLLNALVPGLEIATQAVSQIHETGRHTTTGSRLYKLPGGGMIIDTPGIREFGLWQVTPAQVREYFHEFDGHSAECAFSDCSHTHEPNCAVTPAVATGLISAARYESYRRIMESVE